MNEQGFTKPGWRRLPSASTDGWELESGEARRARYGDSFWLPPLQQRSSLQKGQAAKLLFRMEAEDEDSAVVENVERMWVRAGACHRRRRPTNRLRRTALLDAVAPAELPISGAVDINEVRRRHASTVFVNWPFWSPSGLIEKRQQLGDAGDKRFPTPPLSPGEEVE